MNIFEKNIHIPPKLIGKHPPYQRGTSKLMTIQNNAAIQTTPNFNDLGALLKPGDLLVLNNTKVIPAQLTGHKSTGGQVQATIAHITNPLQAWAMLKSPPKQNVFFIDQIPITITKQKNNLFLLSLKPPHNFHKLIHTHGTLMLPPYLKRQATPQDQKNYQSIFAKTPGSIAAPTASLHFNHRLLHRLQRKGIEIAYITLHVGMGTFLPIKTKHIQSHNMHQEWFCINHKTAHAINKAKQKHQRIIAVGTTALRAVESAWQTPCGVVAQQRSTNLFIYPGYSFKAINGLITNFHRLDSTLIHLVAAFIGENKTIEAYRLAVQKKWSFFSYGDGMFLEHQKSL